LCWRTGWFPPCPLSSNGSSVCLPGFVVSHV
jgi:hypothetical protein